LYSKNLTSLLELLIKDGVLAPDFGDEVIAASCVTRDAAPAAEITKREAAH
jgi:NAD(P) transhydrogenase subunit alpha